MGFMRDQADRLLRTKWKNANMLAEELYAMWTGDEPINIDSPVRITTDADTNEPSLTIRQFGQDDRSIQVERLQQPQLASSSVNFNVPGFDPADFLSNIGDFIVTIQYGDGTIETHPNQDPQEPQVLPRKGTGERRAGGAGGIPGKVVSGSGDTYVMTLYPNGLSGDTETATVKQLQIASGSSIPADTWAVVSVSGDEYVMQVPVWLEDLP